MRKMESKNSQKTVEKWKYKAAEKGNRMKKDEWEKTMEKEIKTKRKISEKPRPCFFALNLSDRFPQTTDRTPSTDRHTHTYKD